MNLTTHTLSMLAALALLIIEVFLLSTGLRFAGSRRRMARDHRETRVAPLTLVAAVLLLVGLVGCDPTVEPASVITRVVTATATDAPAAHVVQPTTTPRPSGAAPSAKREGDATGSIDFAIPNTHLWQKTAGDAYSISGEEDTFAWSEEVIEGDFEFSADVESDFAHYGEGMVVVYGDGKGWTPGCLVFNITGYWQAIRAHSIYDPEVEWLVRNEEKLDFQNRKRYRMAIRVAGGEASLSVDGERVAAIPMTGEYNRRGQIALVKYGGSAPVIFSNIVFKTADTGETIAAAPSKTRAATVTPKNTLTPSNTPAPTNTPAPLPPPTATPSPKPTSPPTVAPPPPIRPPTGMLEDRALGGQGELMIKNGTDADALVILTGMDDKAVKSAYIRNAESFNMTGIPDGTYRLYYSKGEAFSKDTNRFAKNATYQRLDATLEFTTSAAQYTAWEVTLYGVVGGNVGSENVDPSRFPQAEPREGADKWDRKELTAEYGAMRMEGLGARGTRDKHADVPQHLIGFLKNRLSSEDKQELLALIEDYRQELLPLTLLRHHLHRHSVVLAENAHPFGAWPGRTQNCW